MRKIALALAVTLATLWSRPADAGCGGDCPTWIDVLAVGFGVGVVGGYAGGTGYYVYHDVTDDRQSRDYAVGELAFNGLFASIWTGGTVAAIKDRKPGQAAVFGTLALGHTTLAGHGVWRLYTLRNEFRPDAATVARFAALGYATNTVIWAIGLRGEHGRGYGIAEAAVNAPLAAGLGYLAVDRARSGDTREAALFGGMAAVSGALALHGAYTAVFQQRRTRGEPIDFGLDLGLGAGTAVAPTIVTDGKEVAPGLGASGSW
jgi:hypothetical protein